MSINVDIDAIKALSTSQGNDFEMEDISPLVERDTVSPGLLTALFSGITNDIMLQTNTVKYDEVVKTQQLPTGKAFDDPGVDTQKTKPLQRLYEVGSFGLRGNVKPQDYVNRRRPGSNELMDEAYLMVVMNEQMEDSWALFEELAFAQLLTQDTNIILNGPQPQYNFHTDILGVPRPAAVDMQLEADVDHFILFEEQSDLLQTDLQKTGNRSVMKIVLCGKNFFNKRLEIEKQEGLAREVKGSLDLVSMQVPRSNFGDTKGIFQYRWFDSNVDSLRYINYNADILGTPMIGVNNAYMVPVGARNFFKRAYAPAQTRTYANTVAQKRYAWSKEHEFKGVIQRQESNVLYMNVSPQLIRPLTFTPA